ncbi:MAG: peptidoglycan-binding protein [Rhizobiaceae bacterium]
MSRNNRHLDEMADGTSENQSVAPRKPAPANSPLQRRLDERLRELQARSGRLSSAMRKRSEAATETAAPETQLHEQVNAPQPHQAEQSESEPAPEAAPATSEGSADLSRIRERLDVLAQKLQSAADQVPDPVVHEPVVETPVQQDTQTPEPIDTPPPIYVDDGRQEDNFQQLGAELHAMREAMEQMSRNNAAPVDIESVSQSIQSGYAKIAGMLDSHFERMDAAGGFSHEHSGQLSAIGEQVAALRDAVGSMQSNQNAGGLADRVEEIGAAVSSLANSDAEAFPQHFQAIESRLDELTRAVVAVSANPADQEDSIHRLEARLADITKKVDEIAETSRHFAVEQALPQEIGELAEFPGAMLNAMEKVEQRLSSIEGSGEGSGGQDDQLAAQLISQIGELSQKIDLMVETGNVDQHDEAAILARFDALEARLEQLAEQVHTNSGGNGAETLGLIEGQLVALNNRLEQLQLERQENTVNEREAEVLSILEALSAKVEQIDSKSASETAEAMHAPALEEQLKAIASQLETISTGNTDLSPVEQRLESLEQQIALSRDLAIDVASKAAEQAVQSSAGNGSGEPVLLEPLILELRNLEQQAQEMDRRNYDGFAALHECMDRISARLDQIENGFGPVPEDPAPVSFDQNASAEPAMHEQPAYAEPEPTVYEQPAVPENEYGHSSQGVQEPSDYVPTQYDESHEAPVEEMPNEAPVAVSDRLSSLEGAYEEAVPAETGQFDQQAMPPESDNEEFLEAISEMPPPETASVQDNLSGEPADIEDVPLEPGSGVPDLAALVRHASEKRKTGQDETSKGNIADLLNDARNAAKAAASDAAIASMLEEEAKERKRKNLKGGPAGGLKKHRKALMLATAVILVVAVSIPLATRFLGNDLLFSQDSAPATQSIEPATSKVAALESDEQLSPSDDGGNGAMMVDAATDEMEQAEAPEVVSLAEDTGSPKTMEMESEDRFETEADAAPAKMISKVASDDEAQPAVHSSSASMASAENPSSMPAEMEKQQNQSEQMVSVKAAEENTNAILPNKVDAKAEEGRAITVAPMPPADAGNIVLRQAAANGDGKALFEIGRRYTEGDGIDRDLAEASKWYELSATAGYAPGQYRYANFLEKGHGGNTDITGAAKWYEEAAKNGNALAMHNLAVLYTSGLVDGTPNMKKAIDWFEKAAALGVKDSQVNLGIINAQGLGLTADLTNAYKWFAIAAKGGDTDAAGKRDSIANAMPPERLSEARGAAEIWKPVALDPEANVPSVMPEWKNPAGKQAVLSEREMILKTQELLTQKGYDAGPADGLMGERTRQAIISFKRQAGMPADGSVSPELLKALSDGSA